MRISRFLDNCVRSKVHTCKIIFIVIFWLWTSIKILQSHYFSIRKSKADRSQYNNEVSQKILIKFPASLLLSHLLNSSTRKNFIVESFYRLLTIVDPLIKITRTHKRQRINAIRLLNLSRYYATFENQQCCICLEWFIAFS